MTLEAVQHIARYVMCEYVALSLQIMMYLLYLQDRWI